MSPLDFELVCRPEARLPEEDMASSFAGMLAAQVGAAARAAAFKVTLQLCIIHVILPK